MIYPNKVNYLNRQNASESTGNVLCFFEYVFPLLLPSQTSKPASDNIKPRLDSTGLTTQSALEHKRPC